MVQTKLSPEVQDLADLKALVARMRSGELAEIHANPVRVSPEEITW